MEILSVLKLGQSVKNPEVVKRWQQLTNYFVGIFTAAVVLYNSLFPNNALPEDVVLPAAQIFGGLIVVINILFTAASSVKIGISGSIK